MSMRTDAAFLRVPLLLCAAALCACSAVPGCQTATASSAEPRPETRVVENAEAVIAPGPPVLLDPEGPLNVLLILVDGLHDEMPWLGYERDIAPWMTQFEKRAVSYTRAYAISSATARSVGPLLAGRYPSEMWRSGDYFTVYGQENVFVSEFAKAAGGADDRR